MRPAYAKALQARVEAGEAISLVVVAFDWNSGKMLADRPHVARLVVDPAGDIAALDLSLLRGFDVLLLPADDHVFYPAARLALAFGAASVWGEFDNGIGRLEACRMHPGVVAIDLLKNADALLKALPVRRDVGLLCGTGIYKAPMFQEARLVTMGQILGADVEARLRERLAA